MFPGAKAISQKSLDAYNKAFDFALAVVGSQEDPDRWLQSVSARASLRKDVQHGRLATPHTCKYCQRLIIDTSQTPAPYLIGMQPVNPKEIVFDCSVSHIEEGALNGCLLLERLYAETRLPTEEEQRECTYRLVADAAIRGGAHGLDLTSLSRLRLKNMDFPWKSCDKSHRGVADSSTLSRSYLIAYAEQGDPAGEIVKNLPVRSDPVEETVIDTARCHLKHSINMQLADGIELADIAMMPTRLIHVRKVDGSWHLTLEIVKDTKVQYCTLSYCWGTKSQDLSSTVNVRQRCARINFGALPKTVQDAVIVVEKLGMEYLWVDALCIIQEDDEDKTREIAKMSSIYANSVITICTSCALTADEGFLHPRLEFELDSQSYRLPFRLPDDQGLGSVVLGSQETLLTDNRLRLRAWAFQERVLSRRILDFDGQTTSLQWCEPNGQVYVRDGGSLDHARAWSRADSFRQQDYSEESERRKLGAWGTKMLPGTEWMNAWASRICAYTACNLTLPTDRILAIASVAERMAKLTGGTYLAGLWLEHLPWMLMWSMSDRDTRPPRPSQYQGPSWSWTAVNGMIHCYYPTYLYDEDAEVRCDIIGYDLDPKYSYAPFGAMNSATLVIKAKARRARWLRSDKVKKGGDYDYMAYHPHDRPAWSLTLGSDGSTTILETSHPSMEQVYHPADLMPAKLRPDALESEFAVPISEGGQHYLDVILLLCFSHGSEPYGLAVRESKDGVCERVGIFSTYQRLNYRYESEELGCENESSKTRNNIPGQEVVSEDIEADGEINLQEMLDEAKRLGTEMELELAKEEDWKAFITWFDDDDCREQIFVIV